MEDWSRQFEEDMEKFEDRQPVADAVNQNPNTGARGANGWRVRNLIGSPVQNSRFGKKTHYSVSTRQLQAADGDFTTVSGKPLPGHEPPREELPMPPPMPEPTPVVSRPSPAQPAPQAAAPLEAAPAPAAPQQAAPQQAAPQQAQAAPAATEPVAQPVA